MRDSAFQVDVTDARLVTARWTSFKTVDHASAFRAAIVRAVTSCTSAAVVCADWRGARIVMPAIAEVLLSMLSTTNPRIERSAILTDPDAASFGLQVERLVREAANPARRSFRDSEAMLAWLAETLTTSQIAVARSFLATAPE